MNGGQLGFNQLLQLFLQLGIAFKAQFRSETHDGGFAHADLLAERRGGHKRGLIVIFFDIGGDFFMAFRKAF